jgi:hypothetical protein
MICHIYHKRRPTAVFRALIALQRCYSALNRLFTLLWIAINACKFVHKSIVSIVSIGAIDVNKTYFDTIYSFTKILCKKDLIIHEKGSVLEV